MQASSDFFNHSPNGESDIFNQVLVIDDDLITSKVIASILLKNGLEPICEHTGQAAIERLKDGYQPNIVLLDVMMPDNDGFATFKKIRELPNYENIPILFITGTVEQAHIKKCFSIGGNDYIPKPVRESELIARIRLHLSLSRKSFELNELEKEHSMLRDQILKRNIEKPSAFKRILTVSPKMDAIFQYLESISKTSRPVFITGETGTGKELVAQATHQISTRLGKFVPLNVAGLDDNLFSDTLFGHVKGAFTGAMGERQGLIEEAGDGTLFLDEIGDLDMLSQVKLLRLLQEAEYYPLGSDQRKYSNARIVVATHQNIPQLVEEGKFRKDLYYRLRTHHVHIPPLSERKEDISVLTEHFVDLACEQLNKPKPRISENLLDVLMNYHFPGNIRELEGMIFDAVSRNESTVLPIDSFKTAIRRTLEDESVFEKFRQKKEGEQSIDIYQAPNLFQTGQSSVFSGDLIDDMKQVDELPTLKEVTDSLIQEAIERAHGNHAKAAETLGLSRQALHNRLKRKQKQVNSEDAS
ncbi:MAG: sigma-54 dependent transcriptional regulator [Lentisphaeria bacterium]|nr:sigma-54 dependent transcriptional regulator [Lentisphaeria bacterium]